MQHREEESFRGEELQHCGDNIASFGEAYLQRLLKYILEDDSGTVNKKDFLDCMVQMTNILRENQNKAANLEESNKHLASEVIKLRKGMNDLVAEMDAQANEREKFSLQINIEPQKQNLLNLERCKLLFNQIEALLNFIDKEFQKGNPDFQAMMLMERLIYYVQLVNESIQSIQIANDPNIKFKQSFVERPESNNK